MILVDMSEKSHCRQNCRKKACWQQPYWFSDLTHWTPDQVDETNAYPLMHDQNLSKNEVLNFLVKNT